MATNDMGHDADGYLEDRAGTYALLARLYNREIDQPLLDALRMTTFPADSGNERVDGGADSLNGYLHRAEGPDQTELAVDYARLFMLRTRGESSAPYPNESVYTSLEHTNMGASRDVVLSIYRAEGLTRDESWKLGEDHIAIELEFMALMARRSLEAAGEPSQAGEEPSRAAEESSQVGEESSRAAEESSQVREESYIDLLRVQRDFLRDHIVRWVPTLAERMKTTANTDFYRGLADLTTGYLARDLEWLGEALGR